MTFVTLISTFIASFTSGIDPSRKVTKSIAAFFNQREMRKLQNAMELDPEYDLSKILRAHYSKKLSQRKEFDKKFGPGPTYVKPVLSTDVEISTPPRPTGDLNVIFPISQTILNQYPISCASDLSAMLEKGEIIWCYFSTYVIKFGSDFVIKISMDPDTTAFNCMSFLEQCGNPIPASKALGMVNVGKYTYLFMSYVKGVTLDKVWDELNAEQKQHIQSQLNDILVRLRDLSRPEGYPLGGVMREGCRDIRLAVRKNQTPVHSVAEFEDFIFSNPIFGSPIWINFLRQMIPKETLEEVVFTHSDLRPANIKIELDEDNGYKVSGIIDWEYSGFYPSYWEYLRAMSTINSNKNPDWHLHLPKCIKPKGSEQRWLLDLAWAVHVSGN